MAWFYHVLRPSDSADRTEEQMQAEAARHDVPLKSGRTVFMWYYAATHDHGAVCG
jgi:hypothetical protein